MPRRPRIDTIETPSGTTCFLTMGAEDKPPLVLLHGFAGDKLTWQFFLQPLSKVARIYALDMPGHGETQCPGVWEGWRFSTWLKEVLDALEVDQPHMVAHSMGGRIALDFAAIQPVQSLHLLSCAGLSTQFNSCLLQGLAQARDEVQVLDLVRQMMGKNEKLAKATAKALMGKITDASHATALEAIIQTSVDRSSTEIYARPDFERIETPLNFFWGSLDRVVPIPEGLPEAASLTVIEDAGHMLPLEAPGTIIKAIKENLFHA